MTPPMTPEPVAATGRRAVCCVVYGQPTVVMADPARPLDAVLAVALEQTGNVARPLVDWEIRDAQGTPLDRHRAVSSYDFPVDARLFLNLRAGYGGEGPEPVAAMTPERLAEIEAADARDRAADPMDIRAIPAPAEPMGHRTELLREVRRLTAERDAARADALTARKKAVDLLYERDRAREDFRSVQAEWVAARAELAGLRQRHGALERALLDLLDGQPTRCRYHGEDLARSGMERGRPRCESCRIPYAANAALDALNRDQERAAVHDDPPESGGSRPDGRLVICGSVKSSLAEIRRVAAEYRDAGWDVLAPEPATDKAGPELDREWLAAIEQAALVVIVPKSDGSLGESTSRERDHAHACDREVYVRVPASPDAVTTSPPWCDLTVSDLHNDEVQHPCAHRAVCEAFTVSGKWTPACERHASEYSPGRRREFGSTAEPVLGEIPPSPDAVTTKPCPSLLLDPDPKAANPPLWCEYPVGHPPVPYGPDNWDHAAPSVGVWWTDTTVVEGPPTDAAPAAQEGGDADTQEWAEEPDPYDVAAAEVEAREDEIRHELAGEGVDRG